MYFHKTRMRRMERYRCWHLWAPLYLVSPRISPSCGHSPTVPSDVYGSWRSIYQPEADAALTREAKRRDDDSIIRTHADMDSEAA